MKKYNPNVVKLDPAAFYPTTELKQVVKEENGHNYVTYEKVEIDPSKINEGLKADDFRLDVLMANNAVDLLKENHPISMSNIGVADTIEKFVES